jgi:hypothetical protein
MPLAACSMLLHTLEPSAAVDELSTPLKAGAAAGISPRRTSSFGQYSKQRAQAKQSPRSGS